MNKLGILLGGIGACGIFRPISDAANGEYAESYAERCDLPERFVCGSLDPLRGALIVLRSDSRKSRRLSQITVNVSWKKS